MPILGRLIVASAAVITYPTRGRGAWNSAGVGGTLSYKGDAPGQFLRAAATGSTQIAPGLTGFRADRDGTLVSIDDYAVHCAVKAVQNALRIEGHLKAVADGIWGPVTDTAVRAYQSRMRLTVDGVFGRQTAKALFTPLVHLAAADTDGAHATDLVRIVLGTIQLESVWDPAAVGSQDPHDLGLGQINGPAHPTMSANDALNPRLSIPWIVRYVDNNLRAFDYNLGDAVAAYNLGAGGCRTWIKAGRPDLWTPPGATKERDMAAYIERILNPPS